jgi:hypothetical protein
MIELSPLHAARILTEATVAQKVTSLVSKDLSWLWRTAYNCAVQGCTDWEDAGERISELFDIAKAVSKFFVASPEKIDPTLGQP